MFVGWGLNEIGSMVMSWPIGNEIKPPAPCDGCRGPETAVGSESPGIGGNTVIRVFDFGGSREVRENNLDDVSRANECIGPVVLIGVETT